MIDIASNFANYLGSGPNGFSGKNATGASAIDGTEWLAAYIDNWGWGWQQALFDQEGFSPDGSTETVGASQIVDAIGNMIPPGIVVEWNINTDPATYGARYLLLNGQGILISSYQKLVDNVYVGDGNNATAAAYYKADDAAGTIRNTAGAYLILPESRGYTTRGLDLAASVDPLGASRSLGDNQLDAFQGHDRLIGNDTFGIDTTSGGADSIYFERAADAATGNGFNDAARIKTLGYENDGVNGTPRTSSESRMTNRSTQFAIKY